MWLILQHDKPEDWVIATGRTTSIREFVIMAFSHLGIELDFTGHGLNERAVVKSCSNKLFKLPLGKEVLAVDPKYFRPTEVDLLIGDSSKAKQKLGWKPEISLEELVKEMVDSDLKLFKKDRILRDAGYETLNYFE